MDELLALARAEQDRARTFMRRRLYGHAITLAAAVATVFTHEATDDALALVAVTSEAVARALRWRAGELNHLAERALRRGLITTALGSDPDPTATARMRAGLSAAARRDAEKWHEKSREPDPWSSDVPVGPERLRDSLQQSAFWASHLYRAASRRSSLRLGTLVGAAILIVVALAAAGTGDVAETAARVLTTFLAVLIPQDELGVKLAHDRAADEAERTVASLDRVEMSDIGTALAFFGDYATATAAAAPIPTSVYEREHDAIAAAWALRRGPRVS
jgi:hypothetical protein